MFEPPGKKTNKVTWSDCSAVPFDSEAASLSIVNGSEVIAPAVITDNEADPPTVESEVVSPSTVDGSEPPMPSVIADIEVTTPYVLIERELASSSPISSSEIGATEQQPCDSFPAVNKNMDANIDDINSRQKRETEETRGFSDISSNIAEELGKFALSTLDAIDADSNKRIVEKIQSAQKEVIYVFLSYYMFLIDNVVVVTTNIHFFTVC